MAKKTHMEKYKTFENRIGTNYDRPTWYLINSLFPRHFIYI